MREQEKEKKKELDQLAARTYEQVKNPDEFLELIHKMKRGERVDIPLAAFSYIFRNIDEFTIFDKNGNLTIINQDDYFKFKEKASSMLENHSHKENKNKIEDIIKAEKEKISNGPIEIIEHEDGTFMKKDYVARVIEITKPNDEKILINMDDDSIILENIEDIDIETNSSKKLDKKEYAKKEQKRETKEKEMKQKVKMLEHEKSEIEQKLEEEKIKNVKNEDNINSAIENVQEQEKNQSVSKNQPEEKELELEKVENEKDSKKEIKNKKENIKNKIKEKQEKEIKKEKKEEKVKLTFDGSLNNFCQQIKHTIITDIIRFVALCDTDSCRKCVVYDNNVDCILINTYWFVHKLSLLIKNENERETFLDTIFSDKKKGFLDNNFLTQIIEKINHASSLKFGVKIINQEEKENKIINFKSAKIRDEKDEKLYQGTFLYMFMRNDVFKNSLNKNGELDLVFENGCSVEITDESGIKLTYENVNKFI
jgi:hypothetical protein